MTDHTPKPPGDTACTSPVPATLEDTAALVQTLAAPPADMRGTLCRQADILDVIFDKLIAAESYRGTHMFSQIHDFPAHLDLMLKVQRQYTETVRVLSAIDYMSSLTPRAIPPSPLLSAEQTERPDIS